MNIIPRTPYIHTYIHTPYIQSCSEYMPADDFLNSGKYDQLPNATKWENGRDTGGRTLSAAQGPA